MAFINPSAISFAIATFKFQFSKLNYLIFLKSLKAFPIIAVILVLKLTCLKLRTFKSGNHLRIIFNLNYGVNFGSKIKIFCNFPPCYKKVLVPLYNHLRKSIPKIPP